MSLHVACASAWICARYAKQSHPHPARRNMKNFYRSAVSALAFSAAILSGCAGATRLPMRAKGLAGEALQNKQLDLAFLDAPGTQRDEVVNRLSSVDTAYSNSRLFWGRWSESKWGYWWFIAGGTAAAGDAQRI